MNSLSFVGVGGVYFPLMHSVLRKRPCLALAFLYTHLVGKYLGLLPQYSKLVNNIIMYNDIFHNHNTCRQRYVESYSNNNELVSALYCDCTLLVAKNMSSSLRFLIWEKPTP